MIFIVHRIIALSKQIILSVSGLLSSVAAQFSAEIRGDIHGVGPSLVDLIMSALISLSISRLRLGEIRYASAFVRP